MTVALDLPTAAPSATLLAASRRVGVLDDLRTPYAIEAGDGDPLVRVTAPATGASVAWPAGLDAAPAVAAALEVAGRAEPLPVFARVLADAQLQPLLDERRGPWRPVRAVTAADGTALASVWRSERGDLALPFDPDEAILNLRSERYVEILKPAASRGLKRGAMLAYYRARPLLPRRLQIALRRQFARLQARTPFPRWPAETALHDLQAVVAGMLADVAGRPLPAIAAWPAGHRWAMVLTHDVELQLGHDHLQQVADAERRLGFRSAWNFVPRRYAIDDELLARLRADGFEIGVHGLYHDGRDLESLELLRERGPAMREAAERWGAVGFRSPATHRRWEWMPLLGFDYDSSSPDTDPFEPQAGGCCSWLPFFNGELVELPITMAQDHTLFVILRRDERAWIEKAELLREHGGMALIDTHPDYLVDERMRDAYLRLVERFAGDDTVWKALPRDVSAWWRQRAASELQPAADGWQVTGPAAGQATIELVKGSW
ncbi:MAG TPA: hypothetical protein VFT50_10390 [Baekduia sp.]|nr:hypothetical protein [Baekduia sp.]